MHFDPARIFFEAIAFLFAISLHESAHAWMANRCGDPTARMLGRITLNPLRHIDPVGTILLPIIALIANFPMFGWARPTPVTPRNFKNLVRDDILTSVAGPVSNFLAAFVAVILIKIIAFTSTAGRIAFLLSTRGSFSGEGILSPIMFLLYMMMEINVLLAVFNLIPVPPLDGSHVLRHFLSPSVLRIYDSVGMIALVVLVFFGGRWLMMLLSPFMLFFQYLLFLGLHVR
ncbi:MAG TPA: site-2 protease family protein [Candidatus Koribacter sp.]|jgi:Zn-dependent protease